MSKIDTLVQKFREHIQLPWAAGKAPAERVIFLIYDPADERHLLTKIDEFAHASRVAEHPWKAIDISNEFGTWLATHKYREGLFEDPTAIADAVDEGFLDHLEAEISIHAGDKAHQEDAAVAIYGTGSLFNLLRVRKLVEKMAPKIQGRLVVFFPGRYENNDYHLLNRIDGWDYLAVPIVAGNR